MACNELVSVGRLNCCPSAPLVECAGVENIVVRQSLSVDVSELTCANTTKLSDPLSDHCRRVFGFPGTDATPLANEEIPSTSNPGGCVFSKVWTRSISPEAGSYCVGSESFEGKNLYAITIEAYASITPQVVDWVMRFHCWTDSNRTRVIWVGTKTGLDPVGEYVRSDNFENSRNVLSPSIMTVTDGGALP